MLVGLQDFHLFESVVVVVMRMLPGDKHCGPVALSGATGISVETIMSQWPTKWVDIRTDRIYGIWPIDTPWQHRKFLEGVLGRHMIPQGQDGAFPANSIALLHLHNKKDPWYKKLWDGLWNQHWVRVLRDDGHLVEVDWGTEVSYVRFIPRKRFLEMVNLMWPRCVYTIK